jgi:serine/threonine protein kinase
MAKIADFGLCATITPGKSHISNIRNGTPFYAAPEVVSTGILTRNSDVYAFGVLVSACKQ